MFRQSHTIVSTVLAVGLALGPVSQAFGQTQVNQTAPQPAQPTQPAQATPIVINNNAGGGAPASDTAPGRPLIGLRLLGSGAAMFGISYAVTVITAAAITDVCNADSSLGCRDARWPMYIPVAGPFIQMGYVSGSGSNTAKALLAIDGVVQGTGVAMMIAGAVITAKERSRPARYSFAPYATGGGIGLVSMGRF